MKFIFILISVTLLFNFCRPANEITEEEMYTVLNEIIADDSLHINRIYCEFNYLPIYGSYSDEFTENDRALFLKQKKTFENVKIKQNKIKWLNPRTKKYHYASVDTSFEAGMLYVISIPYISLNRHKVLIKIGQDGNCDLCASSGTYLYEKKNGHWIKTKSFDVWISLIKNKSVKTQNA